MADRKFIVVIGGGESGYGSAVLAQEQGFEVLVSDSGAIKEPYRSQLAERGIAFEEGGHSEEKILGAAEIIKSPGVPDSAPLIVRARERGIPIISEIEFAGRYTGGAKTICITGSNGKTTTTSLIYEILRGAGFDAECCGNIGRSFAQVVAERGERQPRWYVLEISSFQLDGMYDFRADIALLLNITPDHLDRYDHRMALYSSSKFRVARNQRPGDTFVYCADDPEIGSGLADAPGAAVRVPFSVTRPVAGAWFDGTLLHFEDFSFPAPALKIKGLHNILNALAAIVATLRAGAAPEAVASGLETFAGVEHRLEHVRYVGNVEYINDSKATNVASVRYALQSMTRPTVWIAGGTDKGNDYKEIESLVREHVKALVCLGADNAKLVKAFTGVVPEIYDTHSLEEAIAACRRAAASGDIVLLSPACASFDLFRNYEDRGRQFKAAVKAL